MKHIIKKCIPSTFINVTMGRFLLLTMQWQVKNGVRPDTSALIAAPGGGNIGDQAMLESFLHNVDGKKLIITTNHNPVTIPSCYALDVEVIKMPGLIYGEPHSFTRDFIKFVRLLPSLKTLSVTGADVMDGGYNPHASAMRAYVAMFVAKYGVASRILGFSWNTKPHKKAITALRSAGKAGVQLLVRDAISHKRLNDLAISNTVLTADVVFSNARQQEQGIDDILAYCDGKNVALVNASGLIAKDIDQIEEYRAIINKLTAEQYTVVLLPHVIRDGANDLSVCKAIADLYPDVYFVDRLLEPDQIKRLAKTAKLVVTGRMHLSIMSINAGTPAIVLSTQGKVDGLMAFFSLPELSLEPTAGFGQKVVALIDQVQNNYEKYADRLADNIESVRLLSKKNFQQ
ncbi:polysaccharide pyruvyl transferase family protein [Methylophaga sp. OBS3]|uniref:polysaccharide pyruvyl transferase family protein n=1 Tax=Methylophaga sp. OBS3 TaxID=2991934 RepID=UPI00224E9FC3|nr:polysaccharide pyruvyl transferase family protein [Methylophaga sp. OBS3]MCX4189095.1 polysaccharide pyruvyl transferase family protein [Methylophaga sp. OBS3]